MLVRGVGGRRVVATAFWTTVGLRVGCAWLLLVAVAVAETGVRHINAVEGLGCAGDPGEWPPAGGPLQPLRRGRSRWPRAVPEFVEGLVDKPIARLRSRGRRPLLRVADDRAPPGRVPPHAEHRARRRRGVTARRPTGRSCRYLRYLHSRFTLRTPTWPRRRPRPGLRG